MPFDGFGTFLRLRSWIVDATNSVKIRADFHDDEDNNFADGLSHCITKDGQTAITQNIPFNSRRIVSLADPIDPQDAVTKDYADTKFLPKDGSEPMDGDVIVRNDEPSITLDGKDGFKDSIFGDKNGKHRWEIVLGDATAESGSNAGSNFDLIGYADDGTTVTGTALFGTRSTALLTVKGDPTAALGIATKQIVDAKLPITGGTVTGALTVNGNLLAASHLAAGANIIYFSSLGSGAYIQWTGNNYVLGSAGTIWHSGNFTPGTVISNVRLVMGGDYSTNAFGMTEPFNGCVVTGVGWFGTPPTQATQARFRYLQVYTTYWWTVSHV